MNPIELLCISIGLSMDAFAGSMCKGLTAERLRARRCIQTGLYFGLFQAGMPLLGYLLGDGFSSRITSLDHWLTFFLLAAIGLKMLLDARHGDDVLDASFAFRTMIPLAVATSIDAMAIGVSFAFLRIRILLAVSLIGLTTFALSSFGVWLGHVFGSRFRGWTQLAGGVILIAMGIKILLEHITA